MTYSTEFTAEWFDAFDGKVTETFARAGSRKIRIKVLEEESTPMSGKKIYKATSTKPFAVVVSRISDGDDRHNNGNLRVYIASGEEGASCPDYEVHVNYAKKKN